MKVRAFGLKAHITLSVASNPLHTSASKPSEDLMPRFRLHFNVPRTPCEEEMERLPTVDQDTDLLSLPNSSPTFPPFLSAKSYFTAINGRQFSCLLLCWLVCCYTLSVGLRAYVVVAKGSYSFKSKFYPLQSSFTRPAQPNVVGGNQILL